MTAPKLSLVVDMHHRHVLADCSVVLRVPVEMDDAEVEQLVRRALRDGGAVEVDGIVLDVEVGEVELSEGDR